MSRAVEVTHVSAEGFWVSYLGRERLLSFEEFPWFLRAAIDELLNVEAPHAGHLHWPDLDVDLTIDSIDHPERFPAVSRMDRGNTRPRAKRRR
jgi:hypothetical protein